MNEGQKIHVDDICEDVTIHGLNILRTLQSGKAEPFLVVAIDRETNTLYDAVIFDEGESAVLAALIPRKTMKTLEILSNREYTKLRPQEREQQQAVDEVRITREEMKNDLNAMRKSIMRQLPSNMPDDAKETVIEYILATMGEEEEAAQLEALRNMPRDGMFEA